MNGQTANGKFFGMVAVMFLSFGVFFLQIDKLYAQILPTSGVQLLTNPQFPSPNSQVRVSLDDYSVNTLGSSIAWYVNGTERKEFLNERSVLVNVGDFGEKTTVRAALTRSGTATFSATTVLTPSVVDIVFEANTYAPSFYKGRALPSAGSVVRVIALVHDGTTAPETSYTYQWTQNSTVLLGGPVKGKNVVEITAGYAGDGISVEVYNSNGTLVGKGTAQLGVVEPELHFYENSPLKGLSEREAVNSYLILSEETTFYAEPYFLDIASVKDADFNWKLERQTTPSDQNVQNALTLRTEGSGSALIDLAVNTRKRVPQYIQKSLQIFFE